MLTFTISSLLFSTVSVASSTETADSRQAVVSLPMRFTVAPEPMSQRNLVCRKASTSSADSSSTSAHHHNYTDGSTAYNFRARSFIPCTQEDVLTSTKRNALLNYLLPEALSTLSRSLSLAHRTASDSSESLAVSPPLRVPQDACTTHVTIPARHTDVGFSDSDFVLYVAAGPTSPSVIAYAFSCRRLRDTPTAASSFNRRVVVGIINAGPRYLVRSRARYYSVLHEVLHAVGFDSGNLRPLMAMQIRGRSKTVLDPRSFPRTLAEYRKHFDCPTLAGVEVEDEGGAGTRLTHFDRRTLPDDIMSPSRGTLLTAITLAVLDDLKFGYIVNYSNADPIVFGRGAGCGFVEQRCDTEAGGKGQWWCFDADPALGHCTPDFKGFGSCHSTRQEHYVSSSSSASSPSSVESAFFLKGANFFDGCPRVERFVNGLCSTTASVMNVGGGGNGENSLTRPPTTPLEAQLGFDFSPTSRCFTAKATFRDGAASNSGSSSSSSSSRSGSDLWGLNPRGDFRCLKSRCVARPTSEKRRQMQMQHTFKQQQQNATVAAAANGTSAAPNNNTGSNDSREVVVDDDDPEEAEQEVEENDSRAVFGHPAGLVVQFQAPGSPISADEAKSDEGWYSCREAGQVLTVPILIPSSSSSASSSSSTPSGGTLDVTCPNVVSFCGVYDAEPSPPAEMMVYGGGADGGGDATAAPSLRLLQYGNIVKNQAAASEAETEAYGGGDDEADATDNIPDVDIISPDDTTANNNQDGEAVGGGKEEENQTHNNVNVDADAADERLGGRRYYETTQQQQHTTTYLDLDPSSSSSRSLLPATQGEADAIAASSQRTGKIVDIGRLLFWSSVSGITSSSSSASQQQHFFQLRGGAGGGIPPWRSWFTRWNVNDIIGAEDGVQASPVSVVASPPSSSSSTSSTSTTSTSSSTMSSSLMLLRNDDFLKPCVTRMSRSACVFAVATLSTIVLFFSITGLCYLVFVKFHTRFYRMHQKHNSSNTTTTTKTNNNTDTDTAGACRGGPLSWLVRNCCCCGTYLMFCCFDQMDNIDKKTGRRSRRENNNIDREQQKKKNKNSSINTLGEGEGESTTTTTSTANATAAVSMLMNSSSHTQQRRRSSSSGGRRGHRNERDNTTAAAAESETVVAAQQQQQKQQKQKQGNSNKRTKKEENKSECGTEEVAVAVAVPHTYPTPTSPTPTPRRTHTTPTTPTPRVVVIEPPPGTPRDNINNAHMRYDIKRAVLFDERNSRRAKKERATATAATTTATSGGRRGQHPPMSPRNKEHNNNNNDTTVINMAEDEEDEDEEEDPEAVEQRMIEKVFQEYLSVLTTNTNTTNTDANTNGQLRSDDEDEITTPSTTRTSADTNNATPALLSRTGTASCAVAVAVGPPGPPVRAAATTTTTTPTKNIKEGEDINRKPTSTPLLRRRASSRSTTTTTTTNKDSSSGGRRSKQLLPAPLVMMSGEGYGGGGVTPSCLTPGGSPVDEGKTASEATAMFLLSSSASPQFKTNCRFDDDVENEEATETTRKKKSKSNNSLLPYLTPVALLASSPSSYQKGNQNQQHQQPTEEEEEEVVTATTTPTFRLKTNKNNTHFSHSVVMSVGDSMASIHEDDSVEKNNVTATTTTNEETTKTARSNKAAAATADVHLYKKNECMTNSINNSSNGTLLWAAAANNADAEPFHDNRQSTPRGEHQAIGGGGGRGSGGPLFRIPTASSDATTRGSGGGHGGVGVGDCDRAARGSSDRAVDKDIAATVDVDLDLDLDIAAATTATARGGGGVSGPPLFLLDPTESSSSSSKSKLPPPTTSSNQSKNASSKAAAAAGGGGLQGSNSSTSSRGYKSPGEQRMETRWSNALLDSNSHNTNMHTVNRRRLLLMRRTGSHIALPTGGSDDHSDGDGDAAAVPAAHVMIATARTNTAHKATENRGVVADCRDDDDEEITWNSSSGNNSTSPTTAAKRKKMKKKLLRQKMKIEIDEADL